MVVGPCLRKTLEKVDEIEVVEGGTGSNPETPPKQPSVAMP